MQTLTFKIAIPEDRHISLDLPESIAPGPAQVVVVVQPQAETLTPSGGVEFGAWRQQQLQRLEPDRVAFQQLLPDLLRTHLNQFVAIYQGKLVDSDRDRAVLIQRTRAHGYGHVYFRKVGLEPRVVDLPSPEEVRHVSI